MTASVRICPGLSKLPPVWPRLGPVRTGRRAGRTGRTGRLTPYGCKVAEDHRASILERLALRAGL